MSAEYDKYLKEHTNAVITCYKLLTGKDLNSHDNSKHEKKMYDIYDQYFYGDKSNDLMFNYAWLIHQNKEPHHWQYWILISDSGDITPMEMPMKYVYEMIADWASFSLRNKKPEELQTWYNDNKDKIILNKITRKKVEKLIPIMVDKMKEYFKKH